MEFDFEKFAELEREREHRETIKSLEAMDDQEFTEVIVDSLIQIMRESIKLENLEKEMEPITDKIEDISIFIKKCLDPVCQDRWGCSVYDLDVQLGGEDELSD